MHYDAIPDILRSSIIMGIFMYALVVTGFVILIIGFRPKLHGHPLRFSPGEFLVSILYGMAATMTGVAEGADSFLTTYREISRDTRFTVRSKVVRLHEEKMAIESISNS